MTRGDRGDAPSAPEVSGGSEGRTGRTRTRERWTLAAESRCQAWCRTCGGPITFGRVVEIRDHRSPSGRAPTRKDRRWIALDPDDYPHAHGVQRVYEVPAGDDAVADRRAAT